MRAYAHMFVCLCVSVCNLVCNTKLLLCVCLCVFGALTRACACNCNNTVTCVCVSVCVYVCVPYINVWDTGINSINSRHVRGVHHQWTGPSYEPGLRLRGCPGNSSWRRLRILFCIPESGWCCGRGGQKSALKSSFSLGSHLGFLWQNGSSDQKNKQTVGIVRRSRTLWCVFCPCTVNILDTVAS